MTGSFGPPTPLPGQPGFRSSPSEAMARETAEMEERLARLKKDLNVEAEMREATGPKVGGARWRSARTDRGSVRAYAKDVKLRHQQQMRQRQTKHGIFASGGSSGTRAQGKPQAGGGARAAAALRHEQQRQIRQQHHQEELYDSPAVSETEDTDSRLPAAVPSTSGFESKEVGRWSVVDTLEWLESLGLGNHRGVFQQNEISGPILLEVGLDDLDYMNVNVLAHRKRILKGIEDLRRGGDGCGGAGQDADNPPPAPASLVTSNTNRGGRTNEISRNSHIAGDGRGTIVDAQEDDGKPALGATRHHWSHLKPLSDNQVKDIMYDSSDRIAESTTNLADGQYDEEAARSSFADAVAEWRGQDSAKKTTTSSPSKELSTVTTARAPVAGACEFENSSSAGGGPGSGSARRERNSKRTAGMLLGVSTSTECWTNPFATPRSVANDDDGEEETGQQQEHVVPPLGRETRIIEGHQQGEVHRDDGDIPTLDEEAEHEAFQRAVSDWNQGKKSGSTGGGQTNLTNVGGAGTGIDCAGSVRLDSSSCVDAAAVGAGVSGAPTSTPRRMAKLQAESLREQMDADHRERARQLEEAKRGLLEGLDAEEQRHQDQRSGIHLVSKQNNGDSVDGHRKEAKEIEGNKVNLLARDGCTEALPRGGGGRAFAHKDRWNEGRDDFKQEELAAKREEEKHDFNQSVTFASGSRLGVDSANETESDEESSRERWMGGGGCTAEDDGGRRVDIEVLESVLGADSASEGRGVSSYVVEDGETSGDDDDL